MKYTLLAISAILTFQLSQAQSSDADKAEEASGMGVKSMEDTLIQVEHDWGNALLKRDVAASSRYLGDDWVLTILQYIGVACLLLGNDHPPIS